MKKLSLFISLLFLFACQKWNLPKREDHNYSKLIISDIGVCKGIYKNSQNGYVLIGCNSNSNTNILYKVDENGDSLKCIEYLKNSEINPMSLSTLPNGYLFLYNMQDPLRNMECWVDKIGSDGTVITENHLLFGNKYDDIATENIYETDGSNLVFGNRKLISGNEVFIEIFDLNFQSSIAYSFPFDFGFYILKNKKNDYIMLTGIGSDIDQTCELHLVKVSGKDPGKDLLWNKIISDKVSKNYPSFIETKDNEYIVAAGGPLASGQVQVFKISNAGSLVWHKKVGSTESAKGISITEAPDGGYIILTSDLELIKINDAGSVEWQKRYEGTNSGNHNLLQSTYKNGDQLYVFSGILNKNLIVQFADLDGEAYLPK